MYVYKYIHMYTILGITLWEYKHFAPQVVSCPQIDTWQHWSKLTYESVIYNH